MAIPGPAHRTHDAPLYGILLIVGAMAAFACLDATAKYLTRDFHVVQIVWARYVFHAILLMAVLPFLGGLARLRTDRLRLQVGRSLLLLCATLFFFTSLIYLQLAEASAIAFVSPLILTALSVPLLGERVGLRRWSAVIVGLLGVLVIIRPGMGVMHWAAVLPIGMAACYAVYQIATRRLNTTDHALTTLFYTAVVGAAVSTLLVPFFWTAPDARSWLLLAVLGLFGGFGHFLLIKAFEFGEASFLAPFNYASILTATAAGYLVFGDFPDVWTFVGAGIVIASGLYVYARERRLHTRPA